MTSQVTVGLLVMIETESVKLLLLHFPATEDEGQVAREMLALEGEPKYQKIQTNIKPNICYRIEKSQPQAASS